MQYNKCVFRIAVEFIILTIVLLASNAGAENGSVSGVIQTYLSGNLIMNPGFESGTTSWLFYTNGTGYFNATSPGYNGTNTARIAVKSRGTNIQLYQTGISLEPQTRYRLSFAAHSTTGHDLTVALIKHVSPFTNYGLDKTFNLTRDRQEFSTEFTTKGFTITMNDGRLMFWLAPFAVAGDTYYIDDVRLEKVKGTLSVTTFPENLIDNPGFESRTTSWQFYTIGYGTFNAVPRGYEASNSAKIALFSGGSNIQLYQKGISLEPQTSYRLSFAAYSTTGHDLTVALIKHVSPFTNYGLDQTFNLTRDWQEFSTEFTTKGFTGTISDVRLMFWFAPFAAGGDEYFIDNVILKKVIPASPAIIANPPIGTNKDQDLKINLEFNDDFENVLFNNLTYLEIPTYDGSGQAVHPDLYYDPTGWNGYKYWMTMTPYPYSDSSKENPSIITSNDGYHWVIPPGLTNPIDIQPGSTNPIDIQPGLMNPIDLPTPGYNSDPNFAFKNGTLYLYYREASNGLDRLLVRSSRDGITWSSEQTSLELANYQLVAPSITYISADDKFYLWYVDSGSMGSQATYTQVILRNSSDGIHWNDPQVVRVGIPDRIIWHVNTEYIPELNEYWMVISAGTGAAAYNTELFFAYSTDKSEWIVLPGKLLGPGRNWDSDSIYQSSIQYIDKSVKIWYSALAKSGQWHMGYLETSLGDLKKDYHWEYGNKGGDYSRNSLQVKNDSFSGMLIFNGNANEKVDVRRKVSYGENINLEIFFYDDGSTKGMKLFRVLNNSNEVVGIGVFSDVSSSFYCYHDKINTYTITSVPRTVGWHKFKIFIQNDKSAIFYIDNINVGSLTSQFSDPEYVQLSSGYYNSVFYVDDLRVYRYSDANDIPSITNQPVSRNIKVDQIATFNVIASGTLPLSYQWRKNGTDIPGATGASYITAPAQLSDNGAIFSVIVTNPTGSVISDLATLTVKSIVSDDFNAPLPIWTVINPRSDANFTMLNIGTPDASLIITVPGGVSHDVWAGGNFAPRIMQTANNSDFEIEAKFLSQITSPFQMQGIIIQQDDNNYLRFDFLKDSATTSRVFAASFASGSPTQRYNVGITQGNPLYLRVDRNGDRWKQSYSYDGTNWIAAANFSHELTVTSVGLFVGNAGYPESTSPAFTGIIGSYLMRYRQDAKGPQ